MKNDPRMRGACEGARKLGSGILGVNREISGFFSATSFYTTSLHDCPHSAPSEPAVFNHKPRTSLTRVRRPTRRGVNRRGQRASAGIAQGRLGADGPGNACHQLLAVNGFGDQMTFRRVAEVTAF